MARANLSGESRNGTATAEQRAAVAETPQIAAAYTGTVPRGARVVVRSNMWNGERSGEVVSHVLAGAADVAVRLSPSEDRQLIADNGGNATLTVQSASLVRSLVESDARLSTPPSTARIFLAEVRIQGAGQDDQVVSEDRIHAIDTQVGVVSDRLDALAETVHELLAKLGAIESRLAELSAGKALGTKAGGDKD